MSPTVYAPVTTEFTPAASRGAQSAEYLECIIAGRPFPAAAPRAYVPPPVNTVAEGIARICTGMAAPNGG